MTTSYYDDVEQAKYDLPEPSYSSIDSVGQYVFVCIDITTKTLCKKCKKETLNKDITVNHTTKSFCLLCSQEKME
ncbi:MAG: hypothetical protein AB1782_10745 [Cyanobacteriota bacterium]